MMTTFLATLAASGVVLVAMVGYLFGRGTKGIGSFGVNSAALAQPDALAGIAALADASQAQATAMIHVADLSAESLRAASGTYVFSLRDRFDERLPLSQIGVASTTWQAVGEAPAPLELLVLHPGDVVRFTLTVVCNQAPMARRMRVLDRSNDSFLSPVIPRFVASVARSGSGDDFVCPSDVSVFIELAYDFAVEHMTVGERFRLPCHAVIEVADTRPEGAVSTTPIDLFLIGSVVPDDDGVGLDLLAIESNIGSEARSYFLDKEEHLELTLPGR